jgi:hypothetical protein
MKDMLQELEDQLLQTTVKMVELVVMVLVVVMMDPELIQAREVVEAVQALLVVMLYHLLTQVEMVVLDLQATFLVLMLYMVAEVAEVEQKIAVMVAQVAVVMAQLIQHRLLKQELLTLVEVEVVQ